MAREVDYGTGRLHGETALGVDIQHVASAGAKLALAVALPDGADAALRAFADEVLARGTSYLTLSTVARYWFYPQLFRDVPGQGASPGVWLTPSSAPECPVCGPPEGRVDPLEVPLRPPSRAAFAAALRSAEPVPPPGEAAPHSP